MYRLRLHSLIGVKYLRGKRFQDRKDAPHVQPRVLTFPAPDIPPDLETP
jgi:hypothetical protein